MTDVVSSKKLPRFTVNRKTLVIVIVAVVVLIAGYLAYRSYASAQQKSRNTTRQSAINTINDSIQLYNIHYGRYPSLNNLNDAKWLGVNMPDLKVAVLKDPSGKGAVVATPTAKAYSYTAHAINRTSPCDNLATYCSSYAITATLEGGGTYTKSADY